MSGLPAPTPAVRQVLAALEAASAATFWKSCLRGWTHRDRHRGTYLSGGGPSASPWPGHLKDAPIVVLDEDHCFADPENEALIQRKPSHG